jgi:hypothetical protein
VQNDPVNFVDPSGLDDCPAGTVKEVDALGVEQCVGVGVNPVTVPFGRGERSGGAGGTSSGPIELETPSTPTEAEPVPQNPVDQQTFPGCVTIGWLLNQPLVSTALDEAWNRTEKSGEENGLFAVFDATNNRVHVITTSQGVHIPDGHGGQMAAMPKFVEEYKKFVAGLGVKVTYITDVHTHPGHYEHPSGADVWALDALGGSGATGVIITNKGKFSLYTISGRSPSQQGALDACRTPNISPPSVHVRF